MVLGIDLGTSNTVAATVSRDGAAVVIPDAGNKDLQSTPTKVLIDKNRAFAGQFAESLFELYPQKKLLSFFKRFFGTGMPVYTDEMNNPWFSEGLAALILRKVKHDAAVFIPDGFEQCVITVPAHYNDVQRKSVFEAARLAELDLSAIIDEPVAAALNYGSGVPAKSEELTLVYDFGGGTFDLTLITQNENHLHVIAKDGIDKLGGKEFDEIIASEVRSGYETAIGRSFPEDPLNQNRLQKLSEELKIEISKEEVAYVSKWILAGKEAFECVVPAHEYRTKAEDLIRKTGAAVTRCLRSMGLQLQDIQNVILIGGTSNSHQVYQYWKELTKNTNTRVVYHQPLNGVAKGAALYAQSLATGSGNLFRSIELKSVSTYHIGLRKPGETAIDLMIHRNSPLPVSAQRRFTVTPTGLPLFKMEVVQYWDEGEMQVLGCIELDASFPVIEDFVLELQLENKANGTIGLKLRDAANGKEIKFTFSRNRSQYQYNYQQQKNLLDNIIINNSI